MPTLLERSMPVYHFTESHGRWINADLDAVWQALSTLTFDQLTITRPLMAIRSLGRRADPGPRRPLLTNGPVRMFEISAPIYAIGGSISRFWQPRPERHQVTTLAEFTAFAEPGWVKVLSDFSLTPTAGGVLLTTMTRGYSTDARARRRFAVYWALIRPGSGLVRRDLLAAVARTAESPVAPALNRFSEAFADLADDEVMRAAWE